MKTRHITAYRLYNQCISHPAFKKPAEVVKWLGAVQGQDYLGALWAIGLRLQHATDQTIEKAIGDKSIIRTWALRATWQFMAAEDARWILKLISPRLLSAYAGYYRKLELDKTVLLKSHNSITKALRDGKQLTRNELRTALEKNGISTEGLRSNFLFLRAALDGLICHGPRRSKEFTFVLLDDWAKDFKKMDRDESLKELATRYFTGHGPATLQDFAWWSGLTLAEIKMGIEMSDSDLRHEVINGQKYWMNRKIELKSKSKTVYLLPAYDEYLVGYKDRSAPSDKKYIKQLGPGSGIFSPTVIINGKVEGTWKRSFRKKTVVIETNLFKPLTHADHRTITKAAQRYGDFLGMPVFLNDKKLIITR